MKILIVGYGEYGFGIKSLIKNIIGSDENIYAFCFDENFENNIRSYIVENPKLIIFSDILGGAPFQIVSREILKNKEFSNMYLVAGVSVSCILDIVINVLASNNVENIRNIIDDSIEKSLTMHSVVSGKDLYNNE